MVDHPETHAAFARVPKLGLTALNTLRDSRSWLVDHGSVWAGKLGRCAETQDANSVDHSDHGKVEESDVPE